MLCAGIDAGWTIIAAEPSRRLAGWRPISYAIWSKR